MKKKCLFLLCLSFLLIFTGCSSSDTPSTDNKNETETTTPTSSTEKETKETKEPKNTKETIQEQEIYNDGDIIVTAKELDKSGFWGPEIKLLVENNSSQNLAVTPSYLTVNGFMMLTLDSVQVASGKKANGSLTLYNSELSTNNITTIAEVEFVLRTYDTDTYETCNESDVITIRTSAYDGFDFSYDLSGDVLFESDGVKVISKGYVKKDNTVSVLIVNDSDRDIIVSTDDFSVNGFMVDGGLWQEVVRNKLANDELYISDSDLKKNGIETVEDMEFTISIIDLNNFSTITQSSPITITINN